MLFGLFKKRAKLQQSDVPAQTTPKNQTEFGDSFGKCGRNARWKYDATDYSFVISGEGAIEQFENINDYHRRTMYDPHNLGPWYDNPGFSSSSIPAAITEIIIPEGITRIESMAFLGFKSLKTITLPKSIEHISESAFLRTKDMVFLVQSDSLAETIVDSMGWNKSYYSNAEATDNEKRNSGQSTEGQQTDTMHKKNLSVIDSYDEDEESLTVDAAVKSLRKQIIARITKSPTVEYLLFRLLWQDAASCFPGRGFGWDLAEFNLDLQTGKLLANVATYPNQFGASYEDVISLSACEFNRIAKQYNMSPELQAFKSDEDWNQLFDDNLKSAVSSACAIQQKLEEDRKNAEIKRYSVKIPANYANTSPNMGLSKITIELRQMYSDCSIQVTNKNGKYQVVYVRVSHTSPNSERHSRVLSVAEAVWLEKQVENTIMNPDVSTWQSLVGGDTMNIEIKGNNGEAISLRGVKPIRQYSDLQGEIANLAEYGYSIVGDNKEKPKAKWQAVYDAAASLHIFKEVNERYLQGDGYKKIIEVLSEKYHSLDIVDRTNPQWKESSRELSITGAYEEWVGHDDTRSESIEMKFKRLHPWEWDEPPEWSAESDWPCEGEFQYLDESKNKGNNWNYSTMRHKAWMLKAPFGLPGVWSFEYISKSDRQ